MDPYNSSAESQNSLEQERPIEPMPSDFPTTTEPSSDVSSDVFERRTTAFDPLTHAEQLPSLFTNEPPARQPEQQPPTVVPRPKHKKQRAWRIIRRVLISILKWAFALVLAVAILAAGMVGYLTVTEYSPAEREKAQSGNHQLTAKIDAGQTIRIATLTTGYGGLGEDADFFMDGGEGVTPESKEVILENMRGIERILSDIDADILFLQEVDTDSRRSYETNQWRQYEYDLPEYETAFALNYSCDYVPYPIGDCIGRVNSGLATFSRFDIGSATRISLPNYFSWPTRVANLKRCVLVTRHAVDGSEKELVLVNCHLEAYDDGEAKQAQINRVMELIQEEYKKGNYVIAGGDFNQSFPDETSYPMRDADNWAPGKLPQLPKGWRYEYDESAPTCRLLDQPYDPNNAQYYVIDGFIVSPNVTVRKVVTVDHDFRYTDHNPVVLEIRLNQE